ncbi:hypothetical protein [Pseudomonas orientalis]|uniref:hypothetical protein n=1 Tax=Pseudomonas orientalis TaxID=76758 RepID=UPI0012FFF412|nr:hypothetical protein [Pseudomonas orientalis]
MTENEKIRFLMKAEKKFLKEIFTTSKAEAFQLYSPLLTRMREQQETNSPFFENRHHYEISSIESVFMETLDRLPHRFERLNFS